MFCLKFHTYGRENYLHTDDQDTALRTARALSLSMPEVYVQIWCGKDLEVSYVNGTRTYADVPA